MKKYSLIIILHMFAITIAAQQKTNYITINQQYSRFDTNHTFGFLNTIDFDQGIKKLMNHLGKPQKNEAGMIIWFKVSIPHVGDNFDIKLTDGVFTKNATYASYSYFKNTQEKDSTLAFLHANQERCIEITIQNIIGNNVINKAYKAELVREWLNRIVGE